VTAHCRDTQNETIRRGFSNREVRLLTCGFEAKAVTFSQEERARRRAELGVSPDQTVLINVARFWPEKAHEVLLESMKQIIQRRSGIVMWLLGIGPEEQRIRTLSEDMGLGDIVKFLGFRTDLEDVLALADIMVHPSHMEGVPLAVLSGMAAGLPIVATRVGGLPEVIRDGATGILIPPREPSRIADAVLSLIEDPALCLKLGRAAQQFIHEEYSLDAAASRVGNLYAEMISACGRSCVRHEYRMKAGQSLCNIVQRPSK